MLGIEQGMQAEEREKISAWVNGDERKRAE
jgi:hypothetical protein